MPIAISHESGSVTITGNAISWYQVRAVIGAATLYLKHGMSVTRHARPANLRTIATTYTGVAYPRSRQGLERAVADLQRLLDTRTPDEVVTR